METVPTLSPMLAFPNSAEAIAWYQQAFDAQELYRLTDPEGHIVHAEITVAGALVMLADENPQFNRSPQTLGGTTIILNLHLPDVDAFAAKAVGNGAKIVIPIDDQFYGYRSGRILDPFGYQWIISQKTEDVSPEETQRRFTALFKQS